MKVRLDLGKRHDIAKDGLLICFIKSSKCKSYKGLTNVSLSRVV